MSAKTYIVDASNVTRRLKKWGVVDAGNVTRMLKKAYYVDASNVTRLIFAAADNLVMVTGGSNNAYGYVNPGFGTLTPSVLGDGKTIIQLTIGTPTHVFDLGISGFTSNPGIGYLTSILINTAVSPQTYLASAATFVYNASAGIAGWEWTGAGALSFGLTVPVVVTRS